MTTGIVEGVDFPVRRGEDEELAEAELLAGDGELGSEVREGVTWSGRGSQLSIVGLRLSSIREKTTPEGIYLGRQNSSDRVQ